MIWIAIAVMAVLGLAPFLWFVLRGGRVRGRQDAALALHRAQLAELERDLAEGRILPAEHEAARLEVQRRLLADAALGDGEPGRTGQIAVVATALLVPAFAIGLYAADGVPNYRQAAAQAAAAAAPPSAEDMARDREMIDRLKVALARMDPAEERTRQGYMMLGNAELSVGDLSAAADAFQTALKARFDPSLGAETAEVLSELAGHVTPQAADLFKRALKEAPADVPWRKAAEKRVAEAGGAS
jgi:cytochrome c-type biogenesis protein CcmH